MNIRILWLAMVVIVLSAGCGDDGGTEADRLGVGAECAQGDDCAEGQSCLPFKGGYCGLVGCTENADCPNGSLCVTHDDDTNYCFRSCTDKVDCNRNRSPDMESNCSSSVTFVEASTSAKACVPPSSDTTEGDAGSEN